MKYTANQILMSVVLVMNNNKDQILNTLAQLDRLKAYNFGFETIVVCFEHSSELEDELKSYYPDVIVEISDQNNEAHARNLAAKKSSGSELLFLKGSFHLPALSLLTFYQQKIIHREYALLTARQQNKNGKELPCSGYFDQLPIFEKITNMIRSFFIRSAKKNSEVSQVDWISETMLMVDKKSFLNAKGWPEHSRNTRQGIELSIRISEDNGKIGCLKNMSFKNLSPVESPSHTQNSNIKNQCSKP